MKKHLIAGGAALIFIILLIISGYFIIDANRDKTPDNIDIQEEIPESDSVNETDEESDEETDEETGYVLSQEQSGHDDTNVYDSFASDENDENDDNEEDEDDSEANDQIDSEPEFTKVAYLTFDDGPTREVTPGILDLLSEEGITATFFVISRIDVEDIYKRIIDEGHEIGNHSFSHNFRRLYSSGIDAFITDTLRMHDFLYETFGYTAKSYRFPGGSMSWRSNTISDRNEVLEELGYKHFDWHVDSGDANSSLPDHSAERLTNNVLNNVNDRDHVIILMHDYKWRQTTLDALPAIIAGLREMGYRFDVIENYPG